MITKGEIKSIDYTGNTCMIHVPFFDGAVGGEPFIQKAVFINPPGIYNGYKVGDIVEVGFENQELDQLIVLGKLYLGIDKETDARGVINCQIFDVSQSAKIPTDTSLNLELNNKEIVLENSGATYKTISDIINQLEKNNNITSGNLLDLKTGMSTLIGSYNGSKLYKHVLSYTGNLDPSNIVQAGTLDKPLKELLSVNITIKPENETYWTNYIELTNSTNSGINGIKILIDKDSQNIMLTSIEQITELHTYIITIEYTESLQNE